MDAAMKLFIPAIAALYTIIWAPFGMLQIALMEWPTNAIEWWIVLGNPFTLALAAGLLKRDFDRRTSNG
jgi:hypothetical protein